MTHILQRLYMKLLTYERCPQRLALSCCVGIYIAFSPFVGFHTVMAFLFSWLFALNCAVMLVVSCCINNPWTMVPIYASDYVVGDWLFYFFGIDGAQSNPTWMIAINKFIAKYMSIGNGLSLWAFLIGGNLLGCVISGTVYPILKRILMNHMRSSAK